MATSVYGKYSDAFLHSTQIKLVFLVRKFKMLYFLTMSELFEAQITKILVIEVDLVACDYTNTRK